jgi:hypothetical protein
MVSYTLISIILILSGALFFHYQAIKDHNRIKESQLRLEHIKFINDPQVDKALSKILWEWEWRTFDDYWEKYSPISNPEANITRRVARNYYVALALMVRKGDLDIGLLYDLNPSGVTRYWEKIEPIAKEFRKRNSYPDYLESVEYLAERVKEHRASLGVSSPNKLSKLPS